MSDDATQVRPLRFTDRVDRIREFLTALGLAPRLESDRGGWVDLVAGSGLVALHDAGTSDTGGRPGETRLSFEVADVGAVADALRSAGFGEPAVVDESYGRVLAVRDPLGELVLMDERSDDYYGYLRHRPRRDGRLHVLPVRYAPAGYGRFLTALGLAARPGGTDRWQVYEGPGGRVALHSPGSGEPADAAPGDAAVRLVFETAEPLPALVARLRAAGYRDAQVRQERFGPIALVTDPDGQVVTIHPGPCLVRPAVPADVPALHELGERVTWDAYEPITGPGYVRHVLDTWWQPAQLATSLERTSTFVAEIAGRVVGTANLGRTADDLPVMWKLYVDPSAQGRGVGSSLLSAVLAALPPDADRLALEHVAGNARAAEFYRRRGFQPWRTEADPDGWPDRVWLTLPLADR